MKCPWLLLLVLAWSAADLSAAPLVIKNSRSPDGRWALAVLDNRSVYDPTTPSEHDNCLCLIRARSHRIVARLPEAEIDGGGHGLPLDNIDEVCWSPDGRFLAVNFRAGRLSHDYACFAVSRRGRAVAQKLPEIGTNPKAKLYDGLERRANGSLIASWASSRELRVTDETFEGVLEQVYVYGRGRWTLTDIRVPR